MKLDELFICNRDVFLSKNCKAYQELSLYLFFFQAETSSETKLHMLLVESRKMAENLSNQKSAPDELMQVGYSIFFCIIGEWKAFFLNL